MNSMSNEVRLSLSILLCICLYLLTDRSTKKKKQNILSLGVKVYSCPYGSDINGCHWRKGTLFR